MSTTRQSSSYDERFAVPVEASRRGAHRARVSPAFAFLPYIAVVAVVLGVGALAWTLVGGSLFGNSSTSAQGGGGVTSPTVRQSPAASSPLASVTSPSTTPGTSSSPPTSSSPGTSASVPAGVDQTVSIVVLNGSRPAKSGLAAQATAQLTGAGWSGATVSTKKPTTFGTTTVVYYAQADLKSAALAVVKSLGLGKARLSATRAGTAITVVVASDYAAAHG